MRSIFAHLKRIVLPGGANSNDDRLELDETGIKIYVGSTLIGRWYQGGFFIGSDLAQTSSRVVIIPGSDANHPTVIFIDPPDGPTVGAIASGQVFADIDGNETPYLGLLAPRITTETGTPRIDLIGENSAVPSIRHINIAPGSGIDGSGAYVDVPLDASKTVDSKIGGQSIPRGLIPGKSFTATANSAGIAADGDTDFAITNIPAIDGREIGFIFTSRYSLDAAGEWALELMVNGTKVDEVGYIDEPAAVTKRLTGIGFWTPSATAATDDIVVHANEISGASTLTFIGSANTPRSLKPFDCGIP